jgi:wyosine [tRNA(Phe)-imidazoG37] synthetase (radical SAM superfamily)
MRIIPLVDVRNPAYHNRTALTRAHVGTDHQWNFVQRNMNFDKDLGLAGLYCFHPFNTITIDKLGDVYMCTCQADLPIPVGKIWDFSSLDAIVQHPIARELQASILDGSYRYCNGNNCGLIQSRDLSTEISHRPDTINWINFALDDSCNLTCPSCRKDFVFVSEGPEFDQRMGMVDHIVKLIEQHDHWVKFSISNDGDPFASLVYRDLLSKLNVAGKEVEIEIVTNGILAKAHWHKMSGVHNNIVRFKVSLDAGSAETYAVTRRGGNWEKLIDSISYISDWRRANRPGMDLMANFVVQNANYQDMVKYVELCDSLGFSEICFQRITDWGTYENFSEQAVWMPEHANHADFLKCLADPALQNPKVNLTNLTDLTDKSI